MWQDKTIIKICQGQNKKIRKNKYKSVKMNNLTMNVNYKLLYDTKLDLTWKQNT